MRARLVPRFRSVDGSASAKTEQLFEKCLILLLINHWDSGWFARSVHCPEKCSNAPRIWRRISVRVTRKVNRKHFDPESRGVAELISKSFPAREGNGKASLPRAFPRRCKGRIQISQITFRWKVGKSFAIRDDSRKCQPLILSRLIKNVIPAFF